MWFGAAALALALPLAFALRKARPPKPELRCCVDPRTPADAEALLRLAARDGDAADDIARKLVRLFATFLPSETSLQCMSMCADAPQNAGGVRDFAVCTVYGSMTSALMAQRGKRRSRRRPKSATRPRRKRDSASRSAGRSF